MELTELGSFLRARRAAVAPHQAGVSTLGRRRVPGLRREEVATLAGVSADYLVRLEQGRERNPSTQVLNALSDALQLEAEARLYLFQIAGLTPPALSTDGPEHVDEDLLRLMDQWPDNPALLLGRSYDVLARNSLASALWSPFSYSDNLMLNVFLDQAAKTFYRNWSEVAVNTVAGFRAVAGTWPGDARVAILLDELTARSPEFTEIWSAHDVRAKNAEVKTFVHPEAGELTLRVQTFDVRSSPGQHVVVYIADPGSEASFALSVLSSLTARVGAQRRVATSERNVSPKMRFSVRSTSLVVPRRSHRRIELSS